MMEEVTFEDLLNTLLKVFSGSSHTMRFVFNTDDQDAVSATLVGGDDNTVTLKFDRAALRGVSM